MKKKIKYVFLILYVLIICLILMSSLKDGKKSSEESSAVTDVIVDTVETVTNEEVKLDYDKTHFYVRKVIGHFGSFFICSIFGLLCYYFFLLKEKNALIISVCSGAVIAVASELLQLLSIGRYCEITDMIIDYSGYICGSLIVILIIYLVNKKKLKQMSNENA